MAAARAALPPAPGPGVGPVHVSRKPLVLEGYLAPRTQEISTGPRGPRRRRAGRAGPAAGRSRRAVRVRRDRLPMVEPVRARRRRSVPRRRATASIPAYPRAMLTDLDPPWLDTAPGSIRRHGSEFVAPWRYPAHNMAGMRNGWEAPRTHVGPYLQGQNAGVLMDKQAGQRRRAPAVRGCPIGRGDRGGVGRAAADGGPAPRRSDRLRRLSHRASSPARGGAPTGYVAGHDGPPTAGLQPRFRPRLRLPVLGLPPASAEQARVAASPHPD